MNNDAVIHYYTGLESHKKFLFVLQILGPAAYHLQYKLPCCLSVQNQFFLTLIKLRVHHTNYKLCLLAGNTSRRCGCDSIYMDQFHVLSMERVKSLWKL